MPDTSLISSVPPGSNQEVLNRVWEWYCQPDAELSRFVMHPEDPDNSTVVCDYRQTDPKSKEWTGQACGIGCVMPDDIYHPEFENKVVDKLLSGIIPSYAPNGTPVTIASDRFVRFFDGVDKGFLVALQGAHDSSKTVQEFRAALWDLSQAYDLDEPE